MSQQVQDNDVPKKKKIEKTKNHKKKKIGKHFFYIL